MDALVAGRSHILIDFPRGSLVPANRAEEDAAGLSRAYLVRYQAEELINWSVDECGRVRVGCVAAENAQTATRVDSPEIVDETYWHYYDKSRIPDVPAH